MDKSKALDAALTQIERNFGKGSIMRLGKTNKSMDIETNVTLVFSAAQALLAAKAGAAYVSPFLGRLDDVGQDGMELVQQILTIYANYGYATRIIAASVRHPLHVLDAALAGAHIATVPFKILTQLLNHPLTDKGIAAFLKDWEKKEGK